MRYTRENNVLQYPPIKQYGRLIFKCFLFGLTSLLLTSSALAFSGGGGGRTPPGRIATIYKGGVDAIGVHFGGDKEPCPEHSTENQGLCYCDEGYTHDGMGSCVTDMCVEYEPTDCLPDCDPLTGDPVAGNEGKYCENKTGRCIVGVCVPINCNSCEDLVDGLCVTRTCGTGEICNTAQNACLCDTENKYYGETGNCQLCNETGSIFKDAVCQCDNDNKYYGEANNCSLCDGTGTIISNNTCICDNNNNYYGEIDACATCEGNNREIKNNDCVCINGYEEFNSECVEKCADGYQRNQTTGECELTCTPGVDTCGDNECYICNEETSTCQNACIPVDYLESTGTQYIDTGWKINWNKNINVSGHFEIPTTGKRLCIIGGHSARPELNIEVSGGQHLRLYENSGNVDTFFSSAAPINTKISFNFTYDTSSGNSTLSATGGSFNGSVSATQPQSGICSGTEKLFADNRRGVFSSLKIYNMQIFENGELIRDFTPVHVPFHPFGTRNCLFDQVSKKLFCNQGGGKDFNIPASDDLEPGTCKTDADCLVENECYACNQKTKNCENACMEVEYLQSDGNQYIDTGWKINWNKNINVSGHFEIPTTGNRLCIIGGYSARPELNIEVTTAQRLRLYENSGNVNTFFSSAAPINTKISFNFNYDISSGNSTLSATGGSFNGSISATQTQSGICSGTEKLFTDNRGPGAFKKLNIYNLQISEDGNLIRDFIPMLTPSGPAMFDRVENKLYYNRGTGQFKTNKDE